MNKTLVVSGLVLSGLGGMAYVLLGVLHAETFRPDLAPYYEATLLFVGGGLALALAGAVVKDFKHSMVEAPRAARYFVYAALANMVMAGVFALPVLDPAFEFPILITRWPGVYMVTAFFSFLIVGVLGNAGWAGIIDRFRGDATYSGISKIWLATELTFIQVGSYGLAIFMFLGGYVGASLDYSGGGPGIVGISMEFAVIPSAVSICLIIAGEFICVATFLKALRTRSAAIPTS
ncbi:MAG: hypothetical protein OK452_07805 [Thaumarchaeota archaeon]|nr:hypothetical protein [Nitrososphaerota archaeon]